MADSEDVITCDFDSDTQAVEIAVYKGDVAALAAMVSHYRAKSAGWEGVANERGHTVSTLKEILRFKGIMGSPQ